MNEVTIIEYVLNADEQGETVIISQTITPITISQLLAKFDFQLHQLKTFVNNLHEGKSVRIKEHTSDENLNWKMWLITPINVATLWVGNNSTGQSDF